MYFKFVDEFVTEFSPFLIVSIIACIVAIAWRSTNIPDNWQVRAVYVFDRRIRRLRHIPTLTNHTVSTTLVEGTHPTPESNTESQPETHTTISTQTTEEEKPPENINSEPSCGEASNIRDERSQIIERMDADNDIVRQRRIAFFENRRDTLIDPNEGTSTSPDHHQASESFTSTKSNTINQDDLKDNKFQESSSNEENIHDRNNIRIKLKYLNDELKLVDGKLNEILGDFKRRHFTAEFAENKLVKLIFNGQLLQRDTETLQNCGFFDNCVVHCLIHQNRTPEEAREEAANSRRSSNRRNERDWDLGNLLIVLVSILLSIAWYTRYNYPHLFSITSTVALLIITGLFTIVSIGMFFPDQNVPNIEVHLR